MNSKRIKKTEITIFNNKLSKNNNLIKILFNQASILKKLKNFLNKKYLLGHRIINFKKMILVLNNNNN